MQITQVLFLEATIAFQYVPEVLCARFHFVPQIIKKMHILGSRVNQINNFYCFSEDRKRNWLFSRQCMVEIRWLLPHIGVTVVIHVKRPAVLLSTASALLCKYQQSKQGKKKKMLV